MAAYSGSSFPYWMLITGNGSTDNPGAESENIPVAAGTDYTFTVNASFVAAFADGVSLTLAWYTATGGFISSVTATSGAMGAGEIVTTATTSTAAPSTASYAVATVAANGIPSASNPLSVYSAIVAPANGIGVNVNYAFSYTYWPWQAVNEATLSWQADQFLPSANDSLVIGGTIELMGGPGGVPCTAIPEMLDSNGVGPTFRILAPPSLNTAAYGYEASYDMNAPQPTQDVVASMLLDGERPFGTRASNRTISLPVMIFGTLAGGMNQVLAAREYLMSVIDQQVWQMTWTSADSGKPMLYDCFRALPSIPLYGFNYSAGGAASTTVVGRGNYPIAMITLTIQALPYGRSDVDGIQVLPISNAVAGSPVAGESVVVDDFSSVTAGNGWTQDGDAVRYDPPTPVTVPYPAATYTRSLSAPVSISDLPSLAVTFGQAWDTQWPMSPSYSSNVTLTYTLTDNSGHTLSFSGSMSNVPWGALPDTPRWSTITASIPQGNTSFHYGDVVKYSVTVSNWTGLGVNGLAYMHVWLEDLIASPSTVANVASPRGNLYNLFSLPGSARAPINVQCQLPASAPVSVELTTPGAGNWIPPAYVYSLDVECWGGGGAGATTNLDRNVSAGGGGGGEYAREPALSVVPTKSIPYSIGAGGTPSQLESTVVDLSTPGLYTWPCPANVTSLLVECWGGGAAGAAGGGGGGAGAYATSTLTVTPGTTYYLSVGAGGIANSGTTSADNAARDGGPSWFGSSATTTLATALVGAAGGISPPTGTTTGGSGGTTTTSTGTTTYPGGNGGRSPGGGGGGGGGAAGRDGRGHDGHSPSAYGFGAVWTGGGQGGYGDGDYTARLGTTSSTTTNGGVGGTGASSPGTPEPGTFPGGGGGGGFSGAPLTSTSQSSSSVSGATQVNYLGGNGAGGLVQLTYAVGDGDAVNGEVTKFGSPATTGVEVVANGGESAQLNTVTGGTGGSGSTNTIHFDGGQGGLYTSGPQASWMLGLGVNSLFQTLATATYTSSSETTSAAASSCSQGCAVVVIESAAPVYDLIVTDSAGNAYVNQGQQGGGTDETDGCVYLFTCPLTNPITTSTTLTVSSATAQQYGVIWYATPWAIDATGTNSSSTSGVGTTITNSAGTEDTTSTVYEVLILFNNANASIGEPLNTGRFWYTPSTSTLVAGELSLSLYTALNVAGQPDEISSTLGSSVSWAALRIQLFAASQQGFVVDLDWRSADSAPGATSNWRFPTTVTKNSTMIIAGVTGPGTTAVPSAISDPGGNVYEMAYTQDLPDNGGVMWVASAGVTSAVTAGTSGTVSWGNASAAPNWAVAAYWIPQGTTVLGTGVTPVTGTSSPVTLDYIPGYPSEVALAFVANTVTGANSTTVSAPWNYLHHFSQGPIVGDLYACQVSDLADVTATIPTSASAWGAIGVLAHIGAKGGGGGAAGGTGNAGWPATFYGGAPGYAGGGKGGLGAQLLNTNGGGASSPGGGGGGSYGDTTSSIPGGQGGGGAIRITYQPPLTPFNTLIVHSPGQFASPNLNPLMPIPFSDAPVNTEYVITNPANPAVNAAFNSTYTVLLVNHSWSPPTLNEARTISVTIRQYEYPGGPSSWVFATRSVVPATDVVNGIINMGDVTLPVKDYAQFNDQCYFTFSVLDSNTNDRFQDILFLDTTGQTVLINIDPSQPGYNTYVNYYIDEPTPDRDLGFVGGTSQDRQYSVSLMEYTFISGGTPYISAGDNLLLAYSPTGAPNVGVSYSPRWYLDRIV